ncbi:SpoIIE family protein phosphatase [Kitasatospora viridis]|uniref:protein-serine/threonine phosphatase n=1 Tax=Kitasatospora viridis TaxID=281105 RepID=A0A561T7C4_9ACTN|nr:SpoIIE family protein phosphatase [Kitasatospora viridis]TWF83016.1 PAS domain S-box-containing protein [Kitasatospora viridis]
MPDPDRLARLDDDPGTGLPSAPPPLDQAPFDLVPTATAVLDRKGTVVGWSPAAAHLLGRTAAEVLGRPARELLAEPGPDGQRSTGVLRLRHRDGSVRTVGVEAGRLADIDGTDRWLLRGLDLATAPWWSTSHSVVSRFLAHSPYGIAVLGTDLRYLWLNETLAAMAGVGLNERIGRRFAEVLPDLSPELVEAQMRRTLETGRPVRRLEYRGRLPGDPEREHVYSCSMLRLDDAHGRVLGVCYMGVDITDRWRMRQRLSLLTDSGARIGTTLDPVTTSRELVELVVPRFADFATVDLLEPVLRGEEPVAPTAASAAALRRMAHLSVRPGSPEAVTPIGEPPHYPANSPMVRCLAEGNTVLAGYDDHTDWLDPERIEATRTWRLRAVMAVPVRARGVAHGVAMFVRAAGSPPFEAGDVSLAEELVSRAAVCLDNARRYTREHDTALTLQRSLLPQALPACPALEVAHRYLPGDSHGGVGGDWFDVIPLSGARVALVVGDVAGHGINAAAAMGRLRTAVHTLADMDLPPDELLAHLDDLVLRLTDERTAGGDLTAGEAHNAKCLYVVYDPASRLCTMASAGHVPPALLLPDGLVAFVDLPPGPPLGVGSLPFESAEFELADGTTLALFTDGLLGHATRDPDRAAELLLATLATARPGLDDACADLLAGMLPERIEDDIALLLARPRSLTPDQLVTWELSADPALVADARAKVAEVLDGWGLTELAFTTELIVSELVTNAIRYGASPIRLRLIRQSALICEVFDGSSTSPRLRHARTTDEGGRGLFLVAQLARRWGTRYTPDGKIIWAEQSL